MVVTVRKDYGAPLVGVSPAIRQINASIEKIAASDCGVLIEGESGTGKELVARRVHALSRRGENCFIPVNCANITESLFESQFFGHIRGAFTGAEQTMLGLVRSAHEGTLFLDEVGDIPHALQPKFLRMLQEGEVLPVGATAPVLVDVRIVAATHRLLRDHIREGSFRQDLYYRLNIVRLQVTPLRERPEDVPVLLDHFLSRHAARYGQAPIAVDLAARRRLAGYPWPGNVRELSSWVERLYAVGLEAETLIDELFAQTAGPSPLPEEVLSIEEAQRWAIQRALAQSSNCQRQAARLLKIDRTTLSRKLRQYQLG
jgi:DNA-binding NtrC family response regulator